MAAEPSTVRSDGWIAERIAEVRADGDHQAKVRRIRAAVAAGTFDGEITTTADIDALAAEISG